MISRNYVKCCHCESITMARISIGHSEEQVFSFECNKCFQPISGRMTLNQQQGQITGLFFEGAELVDATAHDFVFNYHPDFPTPTSDPSSMLSPYIIAALRYGDTLQERTARFNMYNSAERCNADIVRLTKSYLAKRWDSFSTSVKEFDIAKDIPLEKEIDKNRALYQILETYMMSIVTSDSHLQLINYFMAKLHTTMTNHNNQFGLFLNEIISKDILSGVQSDLLKLYPRYADLTDEFRPIIMDWDPNEPNLDFSDDVKVEGKNGFESLKSLYVDAYEVMSRGITLLMGVINIEKRGNCNLFTSHPEASINRGKPDPFVRTLLKFHTAANGAKLPMLFEEPIFQSWLGKTLLPKLRNAIGHNSVEYDQQAGTVTYYLDKDHTKPEVLSYGAFLFLVLRAVVRAHQMNHLVKMLYVHKYLCYAE